MFGFQVLYKGSIIIIFLFNVRVSDLIVVVTTYNMKILVVKIYVFHLLGTSVTNLCN